MPNKRIAIFFFAIIIIQLSAAFAIQPSTSRHLKLGTPQAIYERVREGYALAEDARLKIPLWVQYELRPADLKPTVERNKAFKPDPTIPAGSRSETSDYKDSGYDRGHMAPADDMKRSQLVMDDCFLLSNIAPQNKKLNEVAWRLLEAAVQKWVQERGPLTIIMGPVFIASSAGQVSYPVIGKDQVAVPTHFFKIVVDANDPANVQALAFLMPNEDLAGHKFSEYLVSIDEIERLTGLDFLSALPEDVQARIEAQKAAAVWN